jgi:hypothetical protein
MELNTRQIMLFATLGLGLIVLVIAFAINGNFSSPAFTTIDSPAGTDPEASFGDILVLEAGNNITITGDATSDTITIEGSGAVTLVDDPGGVTTTTGTESGLELVSGELSMLRGCDDSQLTKWNLAVEAWVCAPDSTGGTPSFDAITSGTNTTADMVVGTGATITLDTDGGHIESSQTVNPFHNNTGSTIFKCTAVSIAGFDVPANLPDGIIADADATVASIGIAHANIADGTHGFAVVVGTLDGLDTLTAEGWVVGDQLFLNTSGVSADSDCGNTLTNVRPVGAGTGIETMAIVERVHATNGLLKIVANGAYDVTPNLADDNIFIGSSTEVATTTAIPDCDATNVSRLQYDVTTNAVLCDTDTFVSADITDGTISFVDINNTITLASNPALLDNKAFFGANGVIFEGATVNALEGALTSADITVTDKTWVLPDVNGTIITTGDTGSVTGAMILNDTVDIGDDTNFECPAYTSVAASGDGCDVDLAVVTHTHTLWIEHPTAADDFETIWAAISNSYLILSISCESDQTVNFDLLIDDGSPGAVNGSDIACTTFATDATLAGETSVSEGNRLDLAITSVSGTPTWVSISWTVIVVDQL